jgi:hypothetical protein
MAGLSLQLNMHKWELFWHWAASIPLENDFNENCVMLNQKRKACKVHF